MRVARSSLIRALWSVCVVAAITWFANAQGVHALDSIQPVLGAVASAQAGDVEKGKALFEQCAACHSLDGSDSDGPTLKGLIGRKAAALEYRYSAAMKRSGVTWDAVSLDKYITDPQAFMPGNRMAFAGMAAKAERDDLIAYLTVAARDETNK